VFTPPFLPSAEEVDDVIRSGARLGVVLATLIMAKDGGRMSSQKLPNMKSVKKPTKMKQSGNRDSRVDEQSGQLELSDSRGHGLDGLRCRQLGQMAIGPECFTTVDVRRAHKVRPESRADRFFPLVVWLSVAGLSSFSEIGGWSNCAGQAFLRHRLPGDVLLVGFCC